MIRFFAHFLFILAAWTLVIKFAFPIAFALAEGAPWTSLIWWDFWWVAHIWLGWALLTWPRYTPALALGMAAAEIIIVVVKFGTFLPDPEWTIWTTNWFINKMFVLAIFIWIFVYFVKNFRSLTQPNQVSH